MGECRNRWANRHAVRPYSDLVRYVSPSRWPWSLTGYALAGLLPALLMTPARAVAIRYGMHPGLPTTFLVNLLIPATFVATAWTYPRVRFVWIGVPLAIFLYTAERAIEMSPLPSAWSLGFFVARLSPIVTVACIISGAIATATCFAVRPVRIVGFKPSPSACPECGYETAGLIACPECGRIVEKRVPKPVAPERVLT